MSGNDRAESVKPGVEQSPDVFEPFRIISTGDTSVATKCDRTGRDDRSCTNLGLPSGSELMGQFSKTAGSEGKSIASNAEDKAPADKQPPANQPKEVEKTVQKLIEQLSEDRFSHREAAKNKLIEIGPDAIPQLVEARKSGKLGPEELQRIGQAIQGIKGKFEPLVSPSSVKDWQMSTEDKGGAEEMGGTEEPVPDLLSGKNTQVAGKTRAAGLETLAKIERQIGNSDRADKLEQQAKEWRDIDATRQSITKVSLVGEKISDADLEKLRGLPNLKDLRVVFTSATDEGLKHLKDIPGLENLAIYGDFTDKGLENIKGLKDLKSLEVDGTDGNISDNGLANLKGLSKLTKLSIASDLLTDSGLEHFKGLTELKHLSISSSKDMTQAMKGLTHLKGLTKLEEVSIFAPIQDSAINELQSLPSVKELHLNARDLTSKGIEKLGDLKLPNLKELSLMDSSDDTKDAINNLQKKLPKVRIGSGEFDF